MKYYKPATILAMPPSIQNVYTGDDNSTLVSDLHFFLTLLDREDARSYKKIKITKELRRKLKKTHHLC